MLLCLVGGGGGYPSQVLMVGGGVPHPRSGGTPVRSWWWGVPHPRVGVPQSGLDGGEGYPIPGGYPGQVLMVGGTPPWDRVPQPGLDGGGYPPPSRPSQGYPRYPPPTIKTWPGYPQPKPGQGTPPQNHQDLDGVPPTPHLRWGTPPPRDVDWQTNWKQYLLPSFGCGR